jgi:hypothetical protein
MLQIADLRNRGFNLGLGREHAIHHYPPRNNAALE